MALIGLQGGPKKSKGIKWYSEIISAGFCNKIFLGWMSLWIDYKPKSLYTDNKHRDLYTILFVVSNEWDISISLAT